MPDDLQSDNDDEATAEPDRAESETDSLTESHDAESDVVDATEATAQSRTENRRNDDGTDANDETHADDPTDADARRPTEREREYAKMQRRLDEREMGLDTRSEELDEREAKLEERDAALDDREEELDRRKRDLDERETVLEERAEELDAKESELDRYESELNEQAQTLQEDEATLHNYLDDQVEEMEESIRRTTRSALEQYDTERSQGQLGTSGTLLVGLVGLGVSVAGIAYGIALATGATAPLIPGGTANLVLVAALFIVGVAINLGAMATRL